MSGNIPLNQPQQNANQPGQPLASRMVHHPLTSHEDVFEWIGILSNIVQLQKCAQVRAPTPQNQAQKQKQDEINEFISNMRQHLDGFQERYLEDYC